MGGRFEYDGLVLWCGTPDAPAPSSLVEPGASPTVTVGIQPMDASNRVVVDYRLNGGPNQSILADWLWNDAATGAQYFRARFPPLQAGDTVNYVAICRCAGRQVPSPEQARQLPISFRIGTMSAAPGTDHNNRRARLLALRSAQSGAAAAVSVSERAVTPGAIVRRSPERVYAAPAIPISLTVAFGQVPDVEAGKTSSVTITGTTAVENVSVTDVDVVLAKPGLAGRTIVYMHASPTSSGWHTWQATLALPAVPAGDHSLFADAYGKDAMGKPCYKRASATLHARAAK